VMSYDEISWIFADGGTDDPYSIEQLRDPRMNLSIVRPLVDKFYENQDVSMGMLLVSSSYLSAYTSPKKLGYKLAQQDGDIQKSLIIRNHQLFGFCGRSSSKSWISH